MEEFFGGMETDPSLSSLRTERVDIAGYDFYVIQPHYEQEAICVEKGIELVYDHQVIAWVRDGDSETAFIEDKKGNIIKYSPLLDYISNNSQNLERVFLRAGGRLFMKRTEDSSPDDAIKEMAAIIEATVRPKERLENV